jgi:hypothetical protein
MIASFAFLLAAFFLPGGGMRTSLVSPLGDLIHRRSGEDGCMHKIKIEGGSGCGQ